MSLRTIFKHLDQSDEPESSVLSKLDINPDAWEGIITCYYAFH